MAYVHQTPSGRKYILNSLVIKLKGSNVKQQIYYFSLKSGKDSIDALPAGYKIVHSRRTGLPLLKKI